MKPALIAFLLVFPSAVHAAEPFDGLCGEALFNAIRFYYTPAQISTSSTIWGNLRQCDGIEGNSLNNIFSTDPIPFPANSPSPGNASFFYVVEPSYWLQSSPAHNLFNIFPAPVHEIEKRKDYPVIFSDIQYTYNNGIWGTGVYTFSPGYEINCYTAPKGYEGDFARTVMMVVTLYPNNCWQGKGSNIFTDGEFPIFQSYYLKDILKNNNLDPVDERESNRNLRITQIQGKGNPFVQYPRLADHIWGDKSNEPFFSETVSDRVPIKAVYTSEDKFFYCYSPYFPGEVEWYILNNVKYEGATPASLLGLPVGTYTILYGGEKFHGSVVIEIKR